MDENKVYSVVGTVTIGTDEYRDLLTEKFEAEKEKSEWHDKWYKEYCDKDKLENECTKLKKELDKYKKFVEKNMVNNNNDGVVLLMQMLGEDE